jgi:hypothetical protein
LSDLCRMGKGNRTFCMSGGSCFPHGLDRKLGLVLAFAS